MAKTIGQFDFDLMGMEEPGQGEPAFRAPIVHICLKHWGDKARNGSPRVSIDLMGEDEVDAWIDYLKADLEVVRGKAKQAIKDALAKIKISD
jgi:hypothetical protein